VTLSDIRAAARKIANSTNYEAQPNTPVKQLARLVEALAEQMEQQPTLATINAAVADMDRPHWSAGVETR